ncbi:MAG: hypothetical protein ACI9ZT_001310 [Gammaproteobacteria bacterium]|jgi:hypothetical protein
MTDTAVDMVKDKAMGATKKSAMDSAKDMLKDKF